MLLIDRLNIISTNSTFLSQKRIPERTVLTERIIKIHEWVKLPSIVENRGGLIAARQIHCYSVIVWNFTGQPVTHWSTGGGSNFEVAAWLKAFRNFRNDYDFTNGNEVRTERITTANLPDYSSFGVTTV